MANSKSIDTLPTLAVVEEPESVQKDPTRLNEELRGKLLNWCREKTADVEGVNITSFDKEGWQDGLAFCALAHVFVPELVDLEQCRRHAVDKATLNLELAFDIAEEEFDFVGSLFEDEADEWTSDEVAEYVGQFYVFDVHLRKRTEKAEYVRRAAELAEKMDWGDAYGEIFHLPHVADPHNLSMTESQDAIDAYRVGWGAVIDYLGKGHTIDEEVHMRRVEAVALLDEKTSYKPIPETSPKGGYYSEQLRRQWYKENQECVEKCEKDIDELLGLIDELEAEDSLMKLGQLQKILELHRAYGKCLLEWAGQKKIARGGSFEHDERMREKARREEAERNPFGLSRTWCRGCTRAIYKLEEASAMKFKDHVYHRQCFRCSACERTIRPELGGVFEWKTKLYCHQHIAWGKKPKHPFGDPLGEFFGLEKASDPSGILWTFEIEAAKGAYSTHYNASVAKVREKCEVLMDTMKMAVHDKSPSYQRRVDDCRLLDQARRWKPHPETDIAGKWYTRRMMDRWLRDVDTMTLKAMKERIAFTEVQERHAEKSGGRARRNTRRQRTGTMKGRLDMANAMSRRERANFLKALEIRLVSLAEFKAQLIEMARENLDGWTAEVEAEVAAPVDLSEQRDHFVRESAVEGDTEKRKCFSCSKSVYAQEKLEIDDLFVHRLCFRCVTCKRTLKEDKYVVSIDDQLYCLRHAPADEEAVVDSAHAPRPDVPPGRLWDDGVDPTTKRLFVEKPLATSTLGSPGGNLSNRRLSAMFDGPKKHKGKKKDKKKSKDKDTPKDPGKFLGSVDALLPPDEPKDPPKQNAKNYAKKSFGMDRQVRQKIADKYDTKAEYRVRRWLKNVLGDDDQDFLHTDFHDLLRSGTVLCRLLNHIAPKTVKFSKKSQPFHHRQNIQLFLQACEKWGVVSMDLFQTVDLYEGQNLNAVLSTISALDRAVGKKFPDFAPRLGVGGDD